MIRDFSENAKNSLEKEIDLIAYSYREYVSHPKRWYPYERWIRELGTGMCVGKINKHHTEILEECKKAKTITEKVFSNVSHTDKYYASRISSCNDKLNQELKKIKRIKSNMYFSGICDTYFNEYVRMYSDNTFSSILKLSKEGFDSAESIASKFKNSGEGANSLGIFASFLTFGSSNIDLINSESDIDVFSNLISSLKATGDTEISVYSYFEKKFKNSPYLIRDLDNKYGGKMRGLKITGKLLGMANKFVKGFDRLMGDDVNIFDSASVCTDVLGGFFDLSVNAYILNKSKAKSIINNIKSIKYYPKRKIMLVDRDIKYDLDLGTKEKVEKLNIWLSMVNVGIGTIKNAADGAAEIKREKGHVDIKTDLPEIIVNGSAGGIGEVISGLSMGAIKIDTKETVNNMKKDVSNFVNGDNWCGRTIRDPNTPEIGRAVLSGAGAVVIATTEITKSAGKAVLDVGKGLFNIGVAIGNGATSLIANRLSAKKANSQVTINPNVKQVGTAKVSACGF